VSAGLVLSYRQESIAYAQKTDKALENRITAKCYFNKWSKAKNDTWKWQLCMIRKN